MRRLAIQATPFIVGLACVAALGAYGSLRWSLQIDGAITVSGIAAPVEVVRDADAIPHIFASSKPDALFALGYVHAQDRLWQMEFQRRIGHGRLSEIFGSVTLSQDRFLRTVGFGRAARAQELLPPPDPRALTILSDDVASSLVSRPVRAIAARAAALPSKRGFSSWRLDYVARFG